MAELTNSVDIKETKRTDVQSGYTYEISGGGLREGTHLRGWMGIVADVRNHRSTHMAVNGPFEADGRIAGSSVHIGQEMEPVSLESGDARIALMTGLGEYAISAVLQLEEIKAQA